jgi:hypothetical protein
VIQWAPRTTVNDRDIVEIWSRVVNLAVIDTFVENMRLLFVIRKIFDRLRGLLIFLFIFIIFTWVGQVIKA